MQRTIYQTKTKMLKYLRYAQVFYIIHLLRIKFVHESLVGVSLILIVILVQIFEIRLIRKSSSSAREVFTLYFHPEKMIMKF